MGLLLSFSCSLGTDFFSFFPGDLFRRHPTHFFFFCVGRMQPARLACFSAWCEKPVLKASVRSKGGIYLGLYAFNAKHNRSLFRCSSSRTSFVVGTPCFTFFDKKLRACRRGVGVVVQYDVKLVSMQQTQPSPVVVK